MASIKAVEDPSSAEIHIQNTAPALPAEMAATTPTRFPIPTRVAVETTRAWTPEMEPRWLWDRFSTVTRSISGKSRRGMARVRMVK